MTDTKDRLRANMGMKLLPVLLAACREAPEVVAAAYLPPAARVVSAICPWCDVPRRCDKAGYFHEHRARRVKGLMRGGRPRIYVAAEACLGAGERPGETPIWDAP